MQNDHVWHMVGTLKSGSRRVSTGICPTALQKWSTSKETHSMEPPTSLVAPSAPNWAPQPPCWFSYQTLTLCGLHSHFVISFSKMTFIHQTLQRSQRTTCWLRPSQPESKCSCALCCRKSVSDRCALLPALGFSRGSAVYTACEKDLLIMYNFMTGSLIK